MRRADAGHDDESDDRPKTPVCCADRHHCISTSLRPETDLPFRRRIRGRNSHMNDTSTWRTADIQELIAAGVIVAIVAFCGGYFWAIAREAMSSNKAANKQQRKW
ncbi:MULTISPECIES: hypothetical protein [Bradyrhizobium]|uniref:hypothetical protein n=1 Tax=Bradyrhizobium pachyrhizi TaxID=280333 RepID=UPI002AA54BAF